MHLLKDNTRLLQSERRKGLNGSRAFATGLAGLNVFLCTHAPLPQEVSLNGGVESPELKFKKGQDATRRP